MPKKMILTARILGAQAIATVMKRYLMGSAAAHTLPDVNTRLCIDARHPAILKLNLNGDLVLPAGGTVELIYAVNYVVTQAQYFVVQATVRMQPPMPVVIVLPKNVQILI